MIRRRIIPMRSPRLPAILSFTTALVALGTPAAMAAPASSGATSFDYDNCFPQSDGSTFCARGTTTENFTVAPSGTMTLNYHNDGTATYSGVDGCTDSTSNRTSVNYLLTPDATQAYHVTDRSQSTLTCFGQDVTCTFTTVFTLANGAVRVVRQNGTCTPN
ncbi:hypothetical protein SAMN05660690_2721 [Geodermatophilus telluris]|uniref:Secreted protein n=1 Tax=Geodermatophilus telluris TaxID=1190417 RepID=A0A1G6Q781_9ACTN|nr:hypothetical protein [Geodermatophilus telluris]SDC87497.1 hypothetical protein SAMN05660690_2721 [Geodermatophilus telluris]